MSIEYDQNAALNALHLLQIAESQWVSGLDAIRGAKITAGIHEQELRQYGYAINVLVLVRGLDDMCRTKANYNLARAPRAALLDAARYACNRVVHQLTILSQPVGAITVPLTVPFAFDKQKHFRWVPEPFLPRPQDERDDLQRQLRARYIDVLAGRDISPILGQLRQWFEEQVPTLVA